MRATRHKHHERFMQRALALAARACGRTHPNPMVGALIVRGGRVIAEGFHRRAGQAHAEILALRRAGKQARGATLYVTLEPCSHHGRTPPCAAAIIAAGMRRVVYGMRDPNPKVAGKGLRVLRAAGIELIGPVLPRDSAALNPHFIHWARTGRPYVILKVATTLDGKIADARGRSRWITSAATRRYVHEWRARVDAILVGLTTVQRDDSALTVRLPRYRGPQPQAVIWVGDQPIPWCARLLTRRRPTTYCIVNRRRPRDAQRLAARGHTLIVAKSVTHVLQKLGARGVTSLMVEGGAATAGAFLQGDYINYCVVTVAPKLLGGQALGWTDARSWLLTSPKQIQVEKVHIFSDNVIVEGVVR